jgi:hypothetical protein
LGKQNKIKKNKKKKKEMKSRQSSSSQKPKHSNTAALLYTRERAPSRPDIYDPTVPYNNHLISILLNQTIT